MIDTNRMKLPRIGKWNPAAAKQWIQSKRMWAALMGVAVAGTLSGAVLLQVRERVDVPVTADHLIGARAAGAVNIMQVIAVQVCAAVFFFNVNELQCGSPLWS